MECFLVDDLFGINQIYVSKFFSERLHDAVKEGDIDLVEELLEEPGADINAIHYGENLLWTAIMHRQEEMAIFLIDNGIDTTFKCCRIDLQEDELSPMTDKNADKKVLRVKLNLPASGSRSSTNSSSGASTDSVLEGATALADVFVVTCRQLAYEKELYNIVNLIDFKQGCLLKWLKPPSHKVRLIKSARLAYEAAAKEPVLPPDTASPSPRLLFPKRGPRHKHRPPSSMRFLSSAQNQSADKTHPETLHLPNSNFSHRPSSTFDLESTLLTKDSLKNDLYESKSIRSARTAHHRPCQTPKVPLTKTAVVRQRETNLIIKEQQYHLRHPESAEAKLRRPPTRQQTEPGKKMNTPGVVLFKAPSAKNSYSSYANHLPFRHKPVHFDGYIEQMFKKSLHCYQHSPQNVSQRKFVGRI